MVKININSDWEFTRCPELEFEEALSGRAQIFENKIKDMEAISVPHTWYKPDDAFEGTAMYKKTIKAPDDAEALYVEFEGVEQRCVVFVNGIKAGWHQGAYSTFRIRVPDTELSEKELDITVFVNNEKKDSLAPMFGDFTVFWGYIPGCKSYLCKKGEL